MKSVFLTALLMLLMVLTSGLSDAATMESTEIPGGAAITYFQAGAGFTTLINIQEINKSVTTYIVTQAEPCPRFVRQVVPAASVLVHIQVWDMNSNHIVDFNIPFTPNDNVGIAITGNGQTITLSPYSDEAFGGSSMPLNVLFPSNGSDGLQYGYITAVVTADGAGDRVKTFGVHFDVDAPAGIYCAGANTGTCAGTTGNPFDFQNFNTITPSNGTPGLVSPFNRILMRTAILDADGAVGLNAHHLSDFLNIDTLFEADDVLGLNNTSFMDSAEDWDYDDHCDWNRDGDMIDVITTTVDDPNGIGIDPWELYITALSIFDWDPVGPYAGFNVASGIYSRVNFGVVCDEANEDDNFGSVVYKALGSANGNYWARFNEDPEGSGLHSTLITVAPANFHIGSAADITRGVRDTRAMSVFAYNDAENAPSSGINPPEVALSEFGITVAPRPGNSNVFAGSLAGEALINVAAPIFGFVYTEGPAFRDIYPLAREQMAIEQANLGSWMNDADNPALNNIVTPAMYQAEDADDACGTIGCFPCGIGNNDGNDDFGDDDTQRGDEVSDVIFTNMP